MHPNAHRYTYQPKIKHTNTPTHSNQVTNLSFIPELAHIDPERVRLVKLRYAATILANLRCDAASRH